MQQTIAWAEDAQTILPEVIALRREIHADPELGLQCPKTTAKTLAVFEGLPLEIRRSATTSGFIAILRGARTGRTVLLRGDMDALPMPEETGLAFASRNLGVMHSCGHDGHTAMLAGATKLLCQHRDRLAGTVLFMFQPGEEGHHGARHMIDEGLLDDPAPEAAFALHVLPNLASGTVTSREGTFMAAADSLTCTVIGSGGHAAWPSQTADPIPVLCEIVCALQSFVARQISVFDPAVLTVGRIDAGTSEAVIPSTARFFATLRTLSAETRATALAGFRRTAEHVAAAHGLRAEIEIRPIYPATRNHAAAVALTQAACAGIGAAWRPMSEPAMGTEDFAYVLERIPGAMSFLGVAPRGATPEAAAPIHNPRMDMDEAAMSTGVALLCRQAELFLADGFGSAS